MTSKNSVLKKITEAAHKPCETCHTRRGKFSHTCPYLCESPFYDFSTLCNCCNDCTVECANTKREDFRQDEQDKTSETERSNRTEKS